MYQYFTPSIVEWYCVAIPVGLFDEYLVYLESSAVTTKPTCTCIRSLHSCITKLFCGKSWTKCLGLSDFFLLLTAVTVFGAPRDDNEHFVVL